MKATAYSYRWAGLSPAAAVLALAGCSSIEPPTGIVSQAELAVNEAGQGEAAQYAPQPLSQAQRELDNAKRAMDAERYLDARRSAEKALVDAQLAEARAGAEKQKRTLNELREGVRTLDETTQSIVR